MIVAMNIYKIMTLYYSGENTLRFNKMFLDFISRNQQTYLLNKYIDQEFLITVIRNLVRNTEGLEEVILNILLQLTQSDFQVGFKLMNINFFSNFLLNKLNKNNKESVISLLRLLKTEKEQDKSYFENENFITEINRLKILYMHKSFDKEVSKEVKEICDFYENLNKI